MRKTGFTIVELLVVIVVIGIIAAIASISYSGVSNKATVASLQSDLSANARNLKLYQAEYSSYPTTLDSNHCPTAPKVNNSYCLSFSSGNTLASYSGTTTSFLLKIKNGSNSFKITDSSAPAVGTIVTTETINGTPFIANNAFLSANASWGADYDDSSWEEYRYEQTSTFNLSAYGEGSISNAALLWNYSSMYNGAGVCNKYLDFNTINLWTGACGNNISSFNGATLTNNMNLAKGGTFQINWKSDFGDPQYNIWGYQSGMSNPRITFTWTR